jgi:hypothetical protein
VQLTRTESEARQAWERLEKRFAALRLVVNQGKSRLTTAEEGFAFLNLGFRNPPGAVAVYVAAQESVPTYPRTGCAEWSGRFPVARRSGEVIRKLNPILNGRCTYCRVANSNRIFHQIDWAFGTFENLPTAARQEILARRSIMSRSPLVGP